MIKFLLTYFLSATFYFALFLWDASPISLEINQMQTNLTAHLTSLVLEEGMMNGTSIFITSHYSLIIEHACNGLIVYIFLLIFITMFTSTLAHKIKWSIIGYATITLINVLRIWIITLIVSMDKDYFTLAHDYLGNILLLATYIVLVLAFTKKKKATKPQTYLAVNA